MNETIYLVAGGIGLLVAGIGLGYWVARLRVGKQVAKAEYVQQQFDDYRHNVSDHFGRTAEHFQTIGQQYRELYEHMANGADALCDQQAMTDKLSFKPAITIQSVSDDAAPVQESASAPQDYAEGDDPDGFEQALAKPVGADDAQGSSESAASTELPSEDARPEAKPDAGGDDSQRTFH